VRRLLLAANVVPSSPILVTLMKVIRSSETSVPTRAIRHHIPVDDILHNHRREDLKSYIDYLETIILPMVLSACV
jgi:hypothetical protein